MNSHVFHNWLSVSSKNFHQGINFGHKSILLAKTHFWHPLLSDSFLGIRDNVSVLNTQQSVKALLRAFHIVGLILNKKGRVLIINTNPEFSRLCTNFSNLTLRGKFPLSTQKNKKHNHKKLKTSLLSYVSYKWIGGTLTNWKQISKSVCVFAKFSERCEHFLLKNSLDFPKYNRVRHCFQGLLYRENQKMFLAFKQKPDAIFLLNPNENPNILDEAYRLHIPVIAFTEATANPKEITYPIPVNNYSVHFIYFCLKKIIKMALVSKKQRSCNPVDSTL